MKEEPQNLHATYVIHGCQPDILNKKIYVRVNLLGILHLVQNYSPRGFLVNAAADKLSGYQPGEDLSANSSV